MKDWIQVVSNPLGLAGFALFVVFALLARRRAASPYHWLPPVAVAMAFVGLLGGLGLAYVETPSKQTSTAARTPLESDAKPEVHGGPIPVENAPDITQNTKGEQSPAVANVKGSVTMNFGAPSAGSDSQPRAQDDKKGGASSGSISRASKPGQPPTVEQQTTGAQSPAISNVGADVKITVDGRNDRKR